MMKIIYTLILCIICLTVVAQDYSAQVREYMTAIRQGKGNANLLSFTSDKKDERVFIDEIVKYLPDTVSEVRQAAYALLATIGRQSMEIGLRQQVTYTLISGWRDVDSGIAGSVGSHLQQFKPSDFASSGKDSLRVFVQEHVPHFNKLVMLCGYLNMTDLIPVLQSQLQSGLIKSGLDKSATYFALCRLGDEQAIQYVTGSIENAKINDDLVYYFFPDLIYTHQRFAFDYMIKALNSDEKNCESANPEMSEAIPCAYRIMELLAPAIEDFPFKTDASGDIIARDYPEALRVTRDWFQKMNSNYVIINNTF